MAIDPRHIYIDRGIFGASVKKQPAFIQSYLFGREVELNSGNTMRNLSELQTTRTIVETFKQAINELTSQTRGDAEIRDTIKLRNTRPFFVNDQPDVIPRKSILNRIVDDSQLELVFASFLDNCPDIISFAKNYIASQFKLDYVNADGSISNYYPDFIVKVKTNYVVIVVTKG